MVVFSFAVCALGTWKNGGRQWWWAVVPNLWRTGDDGEREGRTVGWEASRRSLRTSRSFLCDSSGVKGRLVLLGSFLGGIRRRTERSLEKKEKKKTRRWELEQKRILGVKSLGDNKGELSCWNGDGDCGESVVERPQVNAWCVPLRLVVQSDRCRRDFERERERKFERWLWSL